MKFVICKALDLNILILMHYCAGINQGFCMRKELPSCLRCNKRVQVCQNCFFLLCIHDEHIKHPVFPGNYSRLTTLYYYKTATICHIAMPAVMW